MYSTYHVSVVKRVGSGHHARLEAQSLYSNTRYAYCTVYIYSGIIDQRGFYLNKVLAGNRFMVSDTVLSEARNGNTAIVVSACSTDVSISNSAANTVESTSSSSVNN